MLDISTKHGLKQAARVISGVLEQGSKDSFERRKFIEELHCEMRLRLGANKCGATIEGKKCEKLQPSGAALIVMVDDRLDPDAVPKDAHLVSGHSLHIIK